jgi:uncharacterized protein
MRDFPYRYGEWALIAGAAEGIGAAFSESIAVRGMNLVMVDRNGKGMDELASKLESLYKIKTVQVSQDLSERDAWKNCINAALPYDCRLLVYVPAYSPVGPFLENKETDLDIFLDLNCRTTLHLVHAFCRNIDPGKTGGILLLSSLAGLIGPPLSAVYAGTKAFNIVLAEALNSEFTDRSIDVMVCCAGMTDTPTFWSSRPVMKKGSSGILLPKDISEYALRKIGKKTICIPGLMNRLIFFFLTKILPRKFSAGIVRRSMLKIYPEQ